MNKDKQIKNLIKKIEKLSPEYQKAIAFVIENYDLVKKMCENSGMTDLEIQNRLARAKESGDYVTLALLAAVRIFNEK